MTCKDVSPGDLRVCPRVQVFEGRWGCHTLLLESFLYIPLFLSTSDSISSEYLCSVQNLYTAFREEGLILRQNRIMFFFTSFVTAVTNAGTGLLFAERMASASGRREPWLWSLSNGKATIAASVAGSTTHIDNTFANPR